MLSNISWIAKDLNEIDKSMMSKIKKKNSRRPPKFLYHLEDKIDYDYFV